HAVTEQVTERVVYELEVVEVDHEQAEGSAGALCADDLLAQSLVQEAVVVETRQLIVIRELSGIFIEPRVLESHRRLVGHRPGEIVMCLAECDRSSRVQFGTSIGLASG